MSKMRPEPISPNQPLAIIGASTRAAAASAVRAGFQPLAADLFADADLRRIATSTRVSPYPEGFIDWLRALEPPAWMYTGALENHPELVDQMAWIAPLLGNPGDVLARIRSPWELANALRSAGLLFPETRATNGGLPQDGTWLTKTYRGASGSGVRVLLRETGRQVDKETRRESRREPAAKSPCLPVSLSPCLAYQRRMDGTPCAAVYVAAAGAATLLGITRQLIGEPWLGSHRFQYAGSIGPWPVSAAARDALTRIGNVLADRFDLAGLFGVDFILNGDEVWTLEVNPRYTASVEIVERCTGASAIAAHVDACRESEIRNPKSGIRNPMSHGKAILFAKRDIVISSEFADYTMSEALRKPWPAMADVSSAGTPIENGRPILTIFAEGATASDVERLLRQQAAELEAKINELSSGGESCDSE
jgi:predicted ATP-grasp superfamily ATP-dependent carboligase